ncbi:MAG: DUF3846 domain-containing protein [Clostridium sp.]|nr:DUF3846 domain-containing protein [Clostridium sp.]
MKEFDVTITETLRLTVSVEASSKEEAEQMVNDQWRAGDHVLDADNFVDVKFESNDGKEISAEREPDNTIEVLMVEPGQYPRMERIGSDLASLQKAVDGDIQAVYPYDDAVALICGEEAKLEGKPLNRALRDEKGEIYDMSPESSSSAAWERKTLLRSRRSCKRNMRTGSVSRKPF